MKTRTYSPILYSPDELAGGAGTPAPEAAAPAPVETPGGQGEPTSMYATYLDSVPEAVRPQIEPVFKQWDADVTRKFQAHTEAVKGWEPYEQLGIRDIDPQDVGHLMAFYEVASDPEAFKSWVKGAYEQLHGASTEEVTAPSSTGDEPQYLTAEQAKELYQQQHSEAQQQAETQRIHDELAGEMRETFDALKKKDPELDEDLIAFLANRDHGDAPSVKESLEAAHAAWMKRLGKVESDALDEKLKQPNPAVTAGAAHSAPKPASSLEEAGARLKERLNAAHSTA